MDMRLPGGDGIDAMIAIRREFPDARIIILTSSEADGEIQRALRCFGVRLQEHAQERAAECH
jgi:DNA-binding NarL/FixJ family response regulator